MTEDGSQRAYRRQGIGRTWTVVRRAALFAGLSIMLAIAGGSLARSNEVRLSWVTQALADIQVTAPERQVTLAWRDADGQVRAGKIDQAKFAKFLEQQEKAVEQQRYQMRTAAVEALDRDIEAIFAVVRDRVPHYADWYFRYRTKYVLMSEAARTALHHVTVDTRSPRHEGDYIHSIAASLSAYLQRQFAVRVLMPSWTEGEVEAAYQRVWTLTEARWRAFTDDQDRQLVDFIGRELTPVAAATALEVGRSDRAPPPLLLLGQHHQEVFDTYRFRRGLLQIRIKRARETAAPGANEASEEEGDESDGDKVSDVLVDLFSKVVDQMASQVGNLVASATAGGVAGAMAGGSSLTLAGMAGAFGGVATTVVPLSALFGAAAGLASDYATNEFEERLNRPSFEKNITDVVAATKESIRKVLILTLSEHIDASRDDYLANTAIDRLVINQ